MDKKDFKNFRINQQLRDIAEGEFEILDAMEVVCDVYGPEVRGRWVAFKSPDTANVLTDKGLTKIPYRRVRFGE